MDERTEAILSTFAELWTETENTFNDLIENYPGFDRLRPMLQFVSQLKQNGEDKFFRLDTSMHRLVFSRSVNHGLRRDQKFIRIDVFDTKFEVVFRDGEKIYREYILDNLNDPHLKQLLKTLKDTLVD